jgi:hypothetical protein
VKLGDLGNLVQQFTSSGDPAVFDEAARSAPRSALAGGLADAFRSGDTPPFASMLTGLFQQSDGRQRAGILNQVIAAIGPAIAGQAAGGTLSRILSRGGQVSEEEAMNVPPEEVERVAEKAEQKDPSIVDRLSDFYADHPGLVKTLGGAALSIVMARMAQRQA